MGERSELPILLVSGFFGESITGESILGEWIFGESMLWESMRSLRNGGEGGSLREA